MDIKYFEQILEQKFFHIESDTYNQEYDACTFKSDDISFRYRKAKIMNKKSGGFVIIWRKNNENHNIPFDYDSFPDNLLISIEENNLQGYFLFPKEVLRDHGILSHKNKTGKMAFRVYPSWEQNLNATALKTQKWQSPYFQKTHKKW